MASGQRWRHRRESSASSTGMPPRTPEGRDSHDLSLSPGDITRDSLVANMLLSLDQFSLDQQFGNYEDDDDDDDDEYHRVHHNHRQWDPPSSSPPVAEHNHNYHHHSRHLQEPFHETAPEPWRTSPAHARARPQDPANSYHHRGFSYSSDLDTAGTSSSKVSSPSDSRGHNHNHTAPITTAANKSSSSTTNGAAAASSSTRDKLGIANANLQAALSGFTLPPSNHQRPVTPPGRGASQSFDRARPRRIPLNSKPPDSYHQFLAESVISPTTSDPYRQKSSSRRSKSAGGSVSRRRHQHGQSSRSRPPLPSPSVIDYDVDYLNDDYGAAPTPTVPSGPRHRGVSGASDRPLPSSASREPLNPPPERKRSTSRSLSLRSSSGKNRQAATAAAAARQQQPPPMPVDDFESAPAPSVGYGKAKDEQRATTSHSTHNSQYQQQQLQKEKPGFFRRVFGGGGSSRNMLAPNDHVPHSSSTTQRPPSSPSRNERPSSGRLTKEQSRSTSVPPSRDTSSSQSHRPPPPPVPPLQKKTSSFFRRRKKSVVDDAPPLPSNIPPLPNVSVAVLSAETTAGADDPSPVSSLRQALDPYLRNSAGSAKNTSAPGKPTALADITNVSADVDDDQDDEPRQEFQRDFSPDYEPSPNARIRTVTKESENTRDAARARKATSPRAANSKPATSKTFLDLDGGSDDEQASRYRAGRYKSGSGSRNDTSQDDTIRAGKKPPRITDQPNPGPSRSRSNLRLPSDGNRSVSAGTMSTETDYKSAPSAPPSVRVEDSDEPSSAKAIGKDLEAMQAKGLDEPLFIIGEPTEDDKLKAKKIYDGLEDFIQKDKAAAWMGEEGPIRKRTLQAYMELYNFTDKSIVSALRSICERLILRAETQQVDRILVAFSKRWCDCNPDHGFKATDIIHTICYSIMLLNTDLHVADIEQKMTRSQFVKNTLSTIRQALLESKPDAFQRPSILPDKSPMPALDSQTGESDRSTIRNSFRPPPKSETQGPEEDCGPLVKNSWNVPLRAWEEMVEQVLKSIYNSIRDDRLPLFGAEDRTLGAAPSQSNLSVMGMLKRTPSVLSKAPSEGQGSTRGRIADGGRSTASRWTSKSRSRPGLGRNGMASSRTSFDDDNSLWSPAMSSATWSRYSLGRTQASMSQDSFASSMPRGDYQQSIGFANALSQSIIRDEDLNGNETAPSIMSSDFMSTQLLEDESLELAGPPWVKEGMVVHKHHLDGLGKRAKDRNWSEVFAVVQKGQLSLFSFSLSKSARQKVRPRTTGRITAPVGGGNWQDNAVNVGTFNLRLTLASALPSPGYSRSRPYVWALSLPTGAVHLFQVGTPEIIREFVNSANYWSARLSTHPLVGGISNIEYGWSDSIVNNALVSAINGESSPPPTGTTTQPPQSGHTRKSSAQSIAMSMKSLSFDHGSGVSFTHSSRGGKLPGDRVHIAPWAPPTQSVRPSNFSEAEQLEALEAYVRSIEGDLQSHNQLRSPMLLAFTPRGQNAAKAMANWERKSSYLLREIVKFRTYVDCLHQAETRRREVYKERDLAQRAARGDLSDTDSDGSGGGGDADEGNETLRPE